MHQTRQQQTLAPRDETARPQHSLTVSEGAKSRILASSFLAGMLAAEALWLGGIAYAVYRLLT